MPLYFVAIVAPAEINAQVLTWKELMRERFGCRVALRSPAHVTLVAPFNMSKEREPDLLGALDFFWSKNQAFHVNLKNFNAFKPRVIYVDVVLSNQLAELKRALEDFLFEGGFPIRKETRPFHPHVTIANRDLEREDFAAAWHHFEQINYETSFEVKGISLLRSEKEGWKIISASATS